MMDWVVAGCLIVGVLFSFFSALGILRMPDAYTRIHASTKAGTIGVGFIMVAVALHFHDISVISRAVGIIVFILMTAPVAAQLLGKSLLMSNYKMWRGHQQD